MKTPQMEYLRRGRLNASLVSVHHADEQQENAPLKGRQIPLGLTRADLVARAFGGLYPSQVLKIGKGK